MGGVAAPLPSERFVGGFPTRWQSSANGGPCHDPSDDMVDLAGRFWEYLWAAGVRWWAVLVVLLMIERLIERAFPDFWKARVDPWFTPQRRKQALILFALTAFVIGNFMAFESERQAKERALAAARAIPSRDPNALYQEGVPVGTAYGDPQIDTTNSQLLFPAVIPPRALDMTKGFEFGN
jgi:hypothetical protein